MSLSHVPVPVFTSKPRDGKSNYMEGLMRVTCYLLNVQFINEIFSRLITLYLVIALSCKSPALGLE